ncbi:MAG TPA: peptidylprolyl isomerase [Longimicrobiaceae bacterium]|nr:peptidylprolyl isomerase [Longimicrobiaceae bacterium]
MPARIQDRTTDGPPFARRTARLGRGALVRGAAALGLAALLPALLGACARRSPLLHPEGRIEAPAPETFRVRFETSRGPFVVEAHRAWAPNGVDRLYHLVRMGFYDDTRFFRVVDRFMVQFGISGDPQVSAAWRERAIPDDPVVKSNRRGFVTFATSGPNTRTTQLFVNYGDNLFLDSQGFAPIGEVVEGMDVVENLWRSYGEGPPRGSGPDQSRIFAEGNAYLQREFPRLDYIESARIVSTSPARQ